MLGEGKTGTLALLWLGGASAAGCHGAHANPAQSAAAHAHDAGLDSQAGAPAAAESGAAGAAGAAGSAGSAAASCSPSSNSKLIGIVSSALSASGSSKLEELVQLSGPGLDLTLAPQQNVAAGLRWEGDRMFYIADAGFWEISAGSAHFYPTASTLIWAIRSGDLDGDGDSDLIVLTMEPNRMPDMSMPSPFVSRLSAWERTPDGLTQRGDVMSVPEMRIGMPYALGDVDADGDLDVIGFEGGLPVAYVHDGAFGFARKPLSTTAPDTQTAVLFMDYRDRNGDGHADLLLVTGNMATHQLENELRVLLADDQGMFGAAGPVTKGEAALVPNGPDGFGSAIFDVTGDGLADVLQQDDQSTDAAPTIHLYVSTSPSELAAPIALQGLGFGFADVDEDGKADIVSTLNGRLIALLSRGNGAFESRDLGVSMARPAVAGFVVDPGVGSAPTTLYSVYKLDRCPVCGVACAGRCLFETCLGCLSDLDCASGRCDAQRCAP